MVVVEDSIGPGTARARFPFPSQTERFGKGTTQLLVVDQRTPEGEWPIVKASHFSGQETA